MSQNRYTGSSAMIADEAPQSRELWSGDVELQVEAQEDELLPNRIAVQQPTRSESLMS
jgi:hypothetical protein